MSSSRLPSDSAGMTRGFEKPAEGSASRLYARVSSIFIWVAARTREPVRPMQSSKSIWPMPIAAGPKKASGANLPHVGPDDFGLTAAGQIISVQHLKAKTPYYLPI